MRESSAETLHRLHGVKRPRIAYRDDDFLDYVLMLLVCEAIIWLAYGGGHVMTLAGGILCAFEIFAFVRRHGVGLRMPLICRRPQDLVYLFWYRIENLTRWYFLAIAILMIENYVIQLTPWLPHQTALMRKVALWLFYGSFLAILAYRTLILVRQLARGIHVRKFLLQTTWRSALSRQPYISLEIVHAYATGVLAHILLVTPWYIVLTHLRFSLIFLPVTVALNFLIQGRFLKVLPIWFYRDHWLCHNCELEFVYLHGPHHDAIPSGLIGVSGNGHLEGFLRHALGAPGPFYHPVTTFLVYGFEIKGDIDGHQFIPGVYPFMSVGFQKINQHSTHHYGRLAPYSFGLKVGSGRLQFLPDEVSNSIRLDERLNGFKWDTPRYERFLALYQKYERQEDSSDEHTGG